MTKVPDRLYKFRDLGDNTRKLIEGRQLYLNSVTKFNDPFEFRFRGQMDEEPDPEQWKSWINLADLTEEQKTHLLALSMAEVARVIGVTSKQFRQQLEQQCGVFCLCQDADNLLLWAHYANSHKGICLEFDTSVAPLNADIHEVIYQTDLPVMSLPSVDFETFSDQVLLGKSPHWKYEREWRLVKNNLTPNDRTLTYPPEALTGVILGCNFPDSERATLNAWVAASGARPKIHRARRSPTEYKVDIKLEANETLLYLFNGVPIAD
ncbi:MAG TPA: DUF2971 domain-containing protein [Polyangiaceae bacterium]|nr:DUF2971 domain-containing protein [Polyangiaceae bacterium]